MSYMALLLVVYAQRYGFSYDWNALVTDVGFYRLNRDTRISVIVGQRPYEDRFANKAFIYPFILSVSRTTEKSIGCTEVRMGSSASSVIGDCRMDGTMPSDDWP